jgi:hypothetical protein
MHLKVCPSDFNTEQQGADNGGDATRETNVQAEAELGKRRGLRTQNEKSEKEAEAD